MSDEELAALLSRHGISHGPIVETTRSLYEKKLTEIISGTKSSLREKSKASEGSDHNSSDHTEWYEETITYTEAYPRPSIRQRIREDFTSSPDVSEKLSSEGSYQEYLLSKPSVETASYRSSLGSEPLERRYFPLQARYDAQDSEKDGKYYAASSTYQTVSQSRPSRSMVSSTSVASKSYAEDSSQEKRFIPLWLQFLVFLLVAGFLVYLYFTVGSSDDNPFVTFME